MNKVLVIAFWLLGAQLIAQDVPADVNNISNGQLKDAMYKAQQQGYTQSQVEAMARAKGLSATEIASLRDRIQNMQSESGRSTIDEARLREDLAEYDLEMEDGDFLENDLIVCDTIIGRIFGSELFSNSRLSFAVSPNIPTPPSYQLGAGDEIVIDIWGGSEKTYQLTVSPDGNVKIPSLGPVYVSGLQMDKASLKLKSR